MLMVAGGENGPVPRSLLHLKELLPCFLMVAETEGGGGVRGCLEYHLIRCWFRASLAPR